MMQNALNSLKKADPIIVRKTFSMKDTVYRKSSPSCEMFHSEMEFDHDIYLVFVILAVAGIITYAAVHRLMKRCCRGGGASKHFDGMCEKHI